VKYSEKMRWTTIALAGFFLIFIWVSGTVAKEYPSLYRGVRPLAMGGAFTAVADDENALYYNPAGLAEISIVEVGIFNPLVEVGAEGLELYQDLMTTDFETQEEAEDFLNEYIGKPQHLKAALSPYVGFNVAEVGVMIAGIAQGTFNAEVRDPAYPEIDVSLIGDYGLLGGVGGKLPFSGLRAGVSLKFINRESLVESYTAVDLVGEDFDKRVEGDMESGSGVSADLGVIYTLPFVPVVDLDVGLALQNFPEMDMGGAADIDSQVNLGLAVKKSIAGFGFTGAMDYMDLTNNTGDDDDWAKHFHLGAEVSFPVILSLQAGLNQGYLSGGFGLSFGVVWLNFATYGEEVGAHAGQKEDRRYVGQVSFGW